MTNSYPFQNRPDMRSREKMTAFLENHFRYYTMNSWNRSTSYANRIKLDALSIPADKYDVALDVACGTVACPDWDDVRHVLISAFEAETGFAAGFNGRSDGYLVMYETEFDPKKGTRVTFPGRGVDQDEDFSEWDIQTLRDRAHAVDAFDKLCDDLRDAFVEIISTYEVRTHEVVTKREVKVLQPRDEEAADGEGTRPNE